MYCASCGKQLEPGTNFCTACGATVGATGAAGAPPPPPPYGNAGRPAAEPLLRPRDGRVIAGVCAAFARRYGWDVVLVRLLLGVATAVTGFFVGIVAYVIAWIVIPDAPYALSSTGR